MKRISPAGAFAVHNYFHVCPESPDGRRVAYSLYPDGPCPGNAGPCDVMVCDREGTRHRKVGAAGAAVHHVGARPTWIDDDRLAYQDVATHTLHIVNVDTLQEVVYEGGVDNYSPVLGRMYYCEGRPDRKSVRYLDLATGDTHTAVRLEEMARFGPLGGKPCTPEDWRFAHAYIAPDGSRIAFAIFVGLRPERAYVFIAQPDGSDVRFYGPKPMHWTFHDPDSLFGHDQQDVKDHWMRRWDLQGNILEVLSGPGCHGTISPDGRWIVTEDWYASDPVNILLYRRGEREPHRVLATMSPTWHLQVHVHPAFSRDGRRVYVNYNEPGGRGAAVYAIDIDE